MDLKYLLKVFIIVIIILSTLLITNSIVLNFTSLRNDNSYSKNLTNEIVIEGLENNNHITMNSSKAFCEVNKGAQQENACSELTKYNCGLTSCCIWTSNNKCKAGNESGPIFGSDSKGKTIPLDYYYFQNKCYGSICPKQ